MNVIETEGEKSAAKQGDGTGLAVELPEQLKNSSLVVLNLSCEQTCGKLERRSWASARVAGDSQKNNSVFLGALLMRPPRAE